jgi:hypothetical protein
MSVHGCHRDEKDEEDDGERADHRQNARAPQRGGVTLGLAAKRGCARAIEIDVDGTVGVAADQLGLGHGILRFVAIIGIAIDLCAGCRGRDRKTLPRT